MEPKENLNDWKATVFMEWKTVSFTFLTFSNWSIYSMQFQLKSRPVFYENYNSSTIGNTRLRT